MAPVVSWAQNTVHTFGAPAAGAPATSTAFGTPAPAAGTTGAFGSSSGLFGAPPSTPTSGVFGSAAPAPATSLFGGTAPAPAGSIFGAPTTPTSAFGGLAGTPRTTGAQPQGPAQAALVAHMNASAQQETERLQLALQQNYFAYSGVVRQDSTVGSQFVTIVYNEVTPEERQMFWVHGMGTGGRILAPPRPQQVSERDWNKAVADNPDPNNYTPIALVGSVALQGRVSWQQERAKVLATNANTLAKSHATISQRSSQAKQNIQEKKRRQETLRKRLLDVMRKVELVRCLNQPYQPDEGQAMRKMTQLKGQVDSMNAALTAFEGHVRSNSRSLESRDVRVEGMPDQSQLVPVLNQQREKLDKLTSVVQNANRDISLIGKRMEPVGSRR